MTYLAESILYREFSKFFQLAERTRRWDVFEDVPWSAWRSEWGSADRAMCAETFCGVEMYLPDYVSEGLCATHPSFAQMWFHINWGYEEAKHAFSLREYLVRTGQRTPEDIAHFAEDIYSRHWKLPFASSRQMMVYGALQEKATWMIYRKHLDLARAAGDEVLATIYRLISRDEAAHAGFYERLLVLCMDEDRAGTVQDFSTVVHAFQMPGHDLVPGYDDRILLMRSAGVDRGVFYREVLLPIMSKLKITRRDLARARWEAVSPAPVGGAECALDDRPDTP